MQNLFCSTDDSITFNKMEVMDQVPLLMLLVNCLRPFVKEDIEVKEAFNIASACTKKKKKINKCDEIWYN